MSLSEIEVAKQTNFSKHKYDEIYEDDIWRLRDVGINPPPYIRVSTMTFKKIHPKWLRKLAKRFIRFQAATKAYYTLQQYLRSLVHFSNFLNGYGREIQPEEINRTLMLSYIEYVYRLKNVNEAKNKLITHIKLIMTLASVEGWENITKEKIMFRDDRLPVRRAQPRYIPNEVVDQLNRHIHNLPPDIARLVLLLQHTGRRIGEICSLPINCTIKDAEGDFFLQYYEFKMKKEETIPISHEMAEVIEEQRLWLTNKLSSQPPKFLFPDKDLGAMRTYVVAEALNKLAVKYKINGFDEIPWHFQPHQFRHTVGTRMINSGVPAHIVQRYLKHNSPEMTMNYAYLHDSTMKAEFAKFQGKLVDITGKIVHEPEDMEFPADLKWLKRNILAQALPNGYCGLPIQQGGCPHANACLSCSHFRTMPQFLGRHRQHLDETKRILAAAEQQGWTRQIEMNKKIKVNLEVIITSLENK